MFTCVKKGARSAGLFFVVMMPATIALAEETAALSGTVTAVGSGEPLDGITVVVSNLNQHFTAPPAAQVTTNADGEWSADIEFPFNPELTVIVEAAGPDHAPGRHGGTVAVNCYFNCGGTDQGSFSISPGDNISGLDISLEPGGRLSGAITRASDDQPLEAARVLAMPIDTPWTRYSSQFHGVADETGQYETTLAVAPGDYHLMAHPAPGENYVIQAWQGYSCQFEQCPILDTDTIEILEGAVTENLDFSMAAGAALSGTLTPADIPRVVRLFDGSGRMLDDFLFAPWEPPGEDQWEFSGLAGGSYYVELGPFSSTEPWLRVLHNGLLCPFSGCERATGDPLVIPAGATLTLPDVALESGGQIEGKLVDATTGEAPPTVGEWLLRTYEILSDDGTVVGGGTIDDVDDEVLLLPSAALPDGEYYVRTFTAFRGEGIGYQWITGDPSTGYLPGYVDGMYPDIVCAGVKCNLDAAEKVTVTDGEITSITIELVTGSNIEGSIVDDETGDPVPGAIARLLSADNEILASVISDNDGQFWFGAFPDGDYYLRTTMSGSNGMGHLGVQHRYFDRLEGSESTCSEMLCDPADGAAITLDGSDAGPFELRVEPGPVISGRITAQPSGLQLNNGRVEVYDSSGTFIGSYRINPSTGQYQTTALAPGDYTLVPVVSPAYSAVITGDTNPREVAGPLSAAGFVVSIGTEDVSADLPVIDVGADQIFDNRFEASE